jgi:serine/threonine-protein kinase
VTTRSAARFWLWLAASAATFRPVCASAADDTDSNPLQSPDSKAAAQALFDEGRSLVAHQQFAEACPSFAESQRLDPGIGTELWLADCYENNGQIASAWASFKEAAAAAALGRDKREAVARDRAAALEARIPRLMVVVSDAAASQGLEVRRDGMIMASTAWGFALPVDPGAHTIAASAMGHVPWSTTVQVAARADTLQVDIPALEDVPPTVAVQETGALRPDPIEAPPSETPPTHDTGGAGNAQRLSAGLLAGAGLLGIGVGTFFSFDAKSTYDASNQGGGCAPNNRCTLAGMQDRARANQQALVATLAMGIGAAAVISGGALYFFAPRGGSTSVAIAPDIHGGAIRITSPW